MIPAELPCRLDPVQGPPIRFHTSGFRCFLGNRPTRLHVEIAENDNGEITVTERDPVTGYVVALDVAKTGTIGDHV